MVRVTPDPSVDPSKLPLPKMDLGLGLGKQHAIFETPLPLRVVSSKIS